MSGGNEDEDDGEDYFDALPLETELGDYRITGYLGRGSFGITYRARETKLKRDVAIKEYMPREWARRFPDNSIGTVARKTSGTFHYGLERFTMEAQNLAACRQENIVKVHRLLEQNATSYMVMELLDGETLETRIVRGGAIGWAELAPIFRALLHGCRAIHRRGILHRDIKPANIVLRNAAEDEADGCQPVLIDFGAAREIRRQSGGRLSTILTEEYAPLEQWTGTEEQGPYTDVYALAATISHALTGKVPTMAPARKSGQVESMVVNAAGLAPDDVLRGLDRGLMLDPAQRPQSVEQWLAEMPSLTSAAVSAGSPVEELAAGPDRPRLDRRAVMALAGGAALAGVAAWLFLSRSDINGAARPLRVDWARAYDPLGPYGAKPAVAMAPDGGGAFVVASVALGEAIHMVAMKLDARGVERARWMSPESNAQAFAVRPAPGGGVFVGGGAEMLVGGGAVVSGKGLLVRLDRQFSSTPVWRREFDGAILNSLIPQGQSELLAAFDGVDRSGVALLRRITGDGQPRGEPIELNDRRGDSTSRVVATPDGKLAVLGARESGANKSIWIASVNADGGELWRTSDGGELRPHGLAWSEGRDIVAAAGALFVVGRGGAAAIDASGTPPIYRSMMMRLDPGKTGAIQWLRMDYEPEPRTAAANASALCLATVGADEPSVYAAGWRNTPSEGWLRQLDGDGNVVWAIDALGPRGFVPTHLQLDETGGYAAGVFQPDRQTTKLMVVRLAA